MKIHHDHSFDQNYCRKFKNLCSFTGRIATKMAWLLGAGGIAVVASYVYSIWDWYKNSARPDLAYLKAIKLKTLDGSGRELMASYLWQNSGAVIMVVRRPG